MYTVKFDSKGGSAVKSITVQHGKTIKAPASPKRTGYSFAGWYIDSACKTARNFSSGKVEKVMTLYAKWKYGEPGQAYKSVASAGTIYSGKSMKFTLTTPKDIYRFKLYLDGKYYKSYKTAAISGSSKTWPISLVFKGHRQAESAVQGI